MRKFRKRKIGDTPVYWILQKSHKDLKDFDAKDAGLCLAFDEGKLFMLTGGEKSVESVFEKSFEMGNHLVIISPTSIALMRLARDRLGSFLILRKGSAQSLKVRAKK